MLRIGLEISGFGPLNPCGLTLERGDGSMGLRVSESGPSDPTHGSGPSGPSLVSSQIPHSVRSLTGWESGRNPEFCALTLPLTSCP